MKKAIAIAAIALAACNAPKKDFTKIIEGMDTVNVVELVGEPTGKAHTALFGQNISMWAYKADTVVITIANGKVGRVIQGNELKEELQQFDTIKSEMGAAKMDSVSKTLENFKH